MSSGSSEAYQLGVLLGLEKMASLEKAAIKLWGYHGTDQQYPALRPAVSMKAGPVGEQAVAEVSLAPQSPFGRRAAQHYGFAARAANPNMASMPDESVRRAKVRIDTNKGWYPQDVSLGEEAAARKQLRLERGFGAAEVSSDAVKARAGDNVFEGVIQKADDLKQKLREAKATQNTPEAVRIKKELGRFYKALNSQVSEWRMPSEAVVPSKWTKIRPDSMSSMVRGNADLLPPGAATRSSFMQRAQRIFDILRKLKKK